MINFQHDIFSSSHVVKLTKHRYWIESLHHTIEGLLHNGYTARRRKTLVEQCLKNMKEINTKNGDRA